MEQIKTQVLQVFSGIEDLLEEALCPEEMM
jgi:hypothetical protein